jgi:hypothetical protein
VPCEWPRASLTCFAPPPSGPTQFLRRAWRAVKPKRQPRNRRHDDGSLQRGAAPRHRLRSTRVWLRDARGVCHGHVLQPTTNALRRNKARPVRNRMLLRAHFHKRFVELLTAPWSLATASKFVVSPWGIASFWPTVARYGVWTHAGAEMEHVKARVQLRELVVRSTG